MIVPFDKVTKVWPSFAVLPPTVPETTEPPTGTGTGTSLFFRVPITS